MATFIVVVLLLSIGAGLGGWGINQATRWLPNLPLPQRLLIGSLAAPLGWLLFCALILAVAFSRVPPELQAAHRFAVWGEGLQRTSELWLGLFGISWAGGLVRAWLAWRSSGFSASGASERPQRPISFFPFIHLGLLPAIGIVAIVQIWREQGDVPDKMKFAFLGTALAFGFASSLLSMFGLSRYRLRALPSQVWLGHGHIGCALVGGPILLGMILDVMADDAQAQGIATLFGVTFAVGAAIHFLQFRRAMRDRLAHLGGKHSSN